MRARWAVLVLLTAAGTAAAQEASFGGTWRLNRQLSQDLAEHIKAVAGSAQMAGGPRTWATETWLPWKAGFGENERLSVRDFLLAAVPAFETIEIEQDAEEVRTIHGEAGSRRFYLKRTSAGTSAISGETVKRQARVEHGQLLLESKGKEGDFREAFSLEGGRLVYVLHLDQKKLEKPLDARLVYDRTE